MLKRILTVLGVFTLVCFSFYYTDSAVSIVRRNDPIMKEIINVSNQYEKQAIDAILFDNNIIPGINGERVNLDKSYDNMKRLGEFNKSLLVFEEVTPTITTTNTYDKYIIRGNPNKREVSILFKVNNTSYIEEIITILNNKNVRASFFLDNSIFEESTDLLRLISLSNNDVEYYSSDYDNLVINNNNQILKSINKKKLNYCYLESENSNQLEVCKNARLHTIIPNIITDKFPYNDIKNKLDNGAIIMLNNNSSVLRELSSIINYVLQKGYKIVPLSNLLQE